MRSFLTLVLAVFFTAGCSGTTLSFENLQTVLLPNGNGALYFTIINKTGSPDRLESVSSDHFQKIEIHKTVIENDKMKMQQIPYLEIPAMGSVELKRGKEHIMLMQPVDRDSLKKKEFLKFTLHFQNREAMDVQAIVRGIGEYEP